MSQTLQRSSTAGVSTSLGLSPEINFSQPANATTFVPFVSHDFAVSNTLLLNTAVRHSVGSPRPGMSSVKVKATVETLVDCDTAGQIIKTAFCTDTVSATGANFAHTFSLGGSGTNALNSYTWQADDGQNSLQSFVGCKTSDFSASVKAGGFLTLKLGIMGATSVVTSASSSPTYSTNNFFEFGHLAAGTALINGVPLDVTDFTIDTKLNLKEHWGASGGRVIIGLNETVRDVSGTFTLEYDNVSGVAINELLWGDPSGPAQGQLPNVPVVFTFTQPGSGGSITFSLGQITIQDVAMSRKRNDIIVQSVKWLANETNPGGVGQADDLKVILVNSNPTPYV